jgi:heterodisulfide reductase subunit B
MNLEAYQKKISRAAGTDLRTTILYLPQLLGLALALDPAQLGIDLNLAVAREFRDRLVSAHSGASASAAGLR